MDALIRFRGVIGTDFNQKRQFVGLEMYVPSLRYLEVVEPSNPDPFAVASTPIANALQFGQAQHRVKVTGVSTYQISSHAIYMQDGQDGIRIQSKSLPLVGPGRRIEAVGFPMLGEYAPILQDAFIRDLGPVAAVQPEPIEAGHVVTMIGDFYQVPNDQQLVQLEGTVEESHIAGGERIWLLRDGSEVFEAHLPLSTIHGMPEIGSGSVLRLVGICTVHADSDHYPLSFSLLLRDPSDLVVLKSASWWTSVHTLIVLGVLAGGMVLVMLWVVILRNRVEKQTRIIRESEERFRDLAQHDFLTGLPNRLMLEEHIAACLGRCHQGHAKAVVFTIDIDRFKRINDTYGHLIGDECLKIVASRLRSIVRKEDVIARTGGEEFTVVVGGLPNPETTRRISVQILDLFRNKVELQGHSVSLTVSVGGALYPDDSENSVMLRRLSDRALYEAKNTGRNRAVFYSHELSALNEGALTNDELVVSGLSN